MKLGYLIENRFFNCPTFILVSNYNTNNKIVNLSSGKIPTKIPEDIGIWKIKYKI